MKIKMLNSNTKSETQNKYNMFCKNIHYIHVVKVPRMAPPNVLSPNFTHEVSFMEISKKHDSETRLQYE